MPIMKALIAGCVLLVLTSVVGAGETREENELLKEYKGEVVIPRDLYQTYVALVAAFESGKQSEIVKFCVAGEIKFTDTPRRADDSKIWKDINLPFLMNGFHKYILNLRQDSDSEFMIRTGTTVLTFIKTKDGTWKLNKYMDKLIQ